MSDDEKPSIVKRSGKINKKAEENLALNKRLYFELDKHSSRINRANQKLEEIETIVLDTFHQYMRGTLAEDNQADPIDAVNAYAKLVDSVCKREKIKLEYVDRLTKMLADPVDEEQDIEEATKMEIKERQDIEQVAEQLLVYMANPANIAKLENKGN